MPNEEQLERFVENIREAAADWDKQRLAALVTEGLHSGFMPMEITYNVLLPILQKACREIDTHDITFPELLMLADTLKAGLDILIPKIKDAHVDEAANGRVVIGTVRGDIHDLGKNLVAAVFESGGYKVIDLGKDVPTTDFISAVEKEKADVLACSTLLTPTTVNMEEVLREVKARKLKVKTIIGGWATSPEFARNIGADAWAGDALDGLFARDKLMTGRQRRA
jgi:5-methyltetrahydrofolate--homocysteine methyltransferase